MMIEKLAAFLVELHFLWVLFTDKIKCLLRLSDPKEFALFYQNHNVIAVMKKEYVVHTFESSDHPTERISTVYGELRVDTYYIRHDYIRVIESNNSIEVVRKFAYRGLYDK